MTDVSWVSSWAGLWAEAYGQGIVRLMTVDIRFRLFLFWAIVLIRTLHGSSRKACEGLTAKGEVGLQVEVLAFQVFIAESIRVYTKNLYP